MANKSYTYDVSFTYKEEGNRATPDVVQVKATTVQRAITKVVKELNTEEDGTVLDKDHEDFVKTADLMVVEVRNVTRGWGK